MATPLRPFGATAVSGGPVYLQGDGGVNCDDPANEYAPAHLSGPLSVTFDDPVNPEAYVQVIVGSRGNSVYVGTLPDSKTVPVPAAGGIYFGSTYAGSGFTCGDAEAASKTIAVTVYVGDFEHGQVNVYYPLSNVD